MSPGTPEVFESLEADWALWFFDEFGHNVSVFVYRNQVHRELIFLVGDI